LNKIGDLAKLDALAKAAALEKDVATKKSDDDEEKSLADFDDFEPIAASSPTESNNHLVWGLAATTVIALGAAVHFYRENAKMRTFHYDLLEEF